MENIVIRKIASHEVESAMNLALEVFMQFEAPDYDPSGVESFKRDIVENPEYLENAQQGICPIYGAFDGDKLVALMGMRSCKTHINLVFTKKEYHRKGIAREIFHYLLNDILAENPALDALTLNSSPYGLPFYLALGFIPLSEEQEINGIRFTPMKYIIESEYITEPYMNCKRFNEQYPEIYRFLLKAGECTHNEHFPWGRFDWMQIHTMLDEDKLTKILLFRDVQGEIVGMATHDTFYDDRVYLLHTTSDKALLYQMVDAVLENEAGTTVIKANSKDTILAEVLRQRQFERKRRDNTVLQLDLSGALEYRIPDGYAINPEKFTMDSWQYQLVIHKGFDNEGIPEPWGEEVLMREVHSPIRTFSIHGAEYCAHCGLWYTEGDTAYVEPVATVPEHRKKGLAKAAIYEACNRARKLGAKRATVLSDQEFYYRIGFECSSEVYCWEKEREMISVHKAKYEDMALAAEIMVTSFRTAFADFVSPETMDACTNPGNCRAMLDSIYQEGKMHFLMGCNQGFLCWQETAEGAEIVAIHSLPESWGTGLGHAMLTETLKQIGNRPIHLWAFKENTRARRFYEKHGFHWDGSERVSEFDGAVEVRYVRNLTRKETADYLLHDCGLLNELTKYGKVHPIGSYRMDMMAWNDLDLDVENDGMSLEKLYSLTSFILGKFQPVWYEAKEEIASDGKTVWFHGFETMITGQLWNVDIWFFDKKKIENAAEYCDSIAQRATPEQKQQIVAIKEELIRRGLYSFEAYRSVDVYRAVTELGITTPEQFLNQYQRDD